MIATIEEPMTIQATTDDASDFLPSLRYDLGQGKVFVRVIVTHSKGEQDAKIMAPPISIPARDARWEVTWELIAGAGVSSVTFIDSPSTKGIMIPATEKPRNPPPEVTGIESVSVTGERTKWRVRLKNKVSDANWFNYSLAIDWYPSLGVAVPDRRTGRVMVIHDPTIAVTSDPVEG